MKTLVVVLGWWHALDTHVTKYSQIYSKMGCCTYTYTAPPHVFFVGAKQKEKVAAKELKKIFESAEEHNCDRIMFHSFSNHGSMMYNAFASALFEYYPNKLEIAPVKGAVFDSGPGEFTLVSCYKAIFASRLPNYAKGAALLPVFSAVALILLSPFPILLTVFTVTGYIVAEKLMNEHFRRSFIDNNLKFHRADEDFKMLFLYSEKDTIVGCEVIEALEHNLMLRGASVELVKFESSGHCAHFVKYPMHYSKTLKSFLKAIFCSTSN